MTKKVNPRIITDKLVTRDGYRKDLFQWDYNLGCWRALVSDAKIADIVASETGLDCFPHQIFYWRKLMLIAPVPRGGSRPGSGRPRKIRV